jgi:MFS transporter, ACS family, DAL5 transporter family protein
MDYLNYLLVKITSDLLVLVAIWAFWALYDFPETAGFLSHEEKVFIVWRLNYQSLSRGAKTESDRPQRAVPEAEEFKWSYVWDAFKDWQIWVNIFVYWGVRFPFS